MENTVSKYLFDPVIGKIVVTLLGITLIIILTRLLQRSLTQYVRDTDTRYRARKFIHFTGYLLVILLLATVYSDKLGGFTIAFGVAGAGIAFALQEVIASIAGWFVVSFAKFYAPGDRVQLGGIKGDVIDISLLRTTLMECGGWVDGDLYNGRVVRVANSFVFKEPVFNYSGDFPFLWDEIKVPVKYGCDHHMVKETLLRIAVQSVGEYAQNARSAWKNLVRKYRIEDASVEPMVTLIANDNWMEFTVRYAVDYKKRRTTKDILFTRILDEVQQSNGRIALASATFQIVETPALDVRILQAPHISNQPAEK